MFQLYERTMLWIDIILLIKFFFFFCFSIFLNITKLHCTIYHAKTFQFELTLFWIFYIIIYLVNLLAKMFFLSKCFLVLKMLVLCPFGQVSYFRVCLIIVLGSWWFTMVRFLKNDSILESVSIINIVLISYMKHIITP